MPKQSAGLCGLDLMLDHTALATAAEPPADAAAVTVPVYFHVINKV